MKKAKAEDKQNIPQAILARRQKATENCAPGSLPARGKPLEDRIEAFCTNPHRTGIAYSGGGIRSATISLGFTEALAVYGRFYAFDMMSTVSGGGYFGSFIRSLFQERKEDKGIVSDRQHFADAVLHSLPDTQYFRGKHDPAAKPETFSAFLHDKMEVKNPLWWLRENGRYLAPNGATDYGFALAYAARNWMSLAFAILIAMAVCFALVQLSLLLLLSGADVAQIDLISQIFDIAGRKTNPLSPLLPVMLPLALVSVGIGLGYWLSLGLIGQKPKWPKAGNDGFFLGTCLILLAIFLDLTLRLWSPSVIWDDEKRAIASSIALVFFAAIASSLISYSAARRSKRKMLSFDFRRIQTRILWNFLIFVLAILAIAIVDSTALWLRHRLAQDGESFTFTALSSTALASLLSWLVAKIPDWIGGKASKLTQFLAAHASKAAFATGVVILFSLAVAADLLVLKVVWVGQAWHAESSRDLDAFALLFVVLVMLMLIIGAATKFLNLVSFTPLYTSRLIRSYLGASNAKRLDTRKRHEITQGMEGDDLSLDKYMTAETAAPLHLINVTLNRTVGSRKSPLPIDITHDDPLLRQIEDERPRGRLPSYESQLVLRDRQGDRMVIGPEGIRAGTQWLTWNKLEKAEIPSVGQFCGISGAAVSSGMGRHTSLGTALALTLANIRLGQWWRHGPAKGNWADRLLHSYNYLFREMIGKYSRDCPYWYLSDGGHSENTGALSLIERGCNFIVVLDNGQDELYEFADLEIFVRTAHTDIGIEIEVVKESDFPTDFGLPKDRFFNGGPDDWRKTAKGKKGNAFALLLEAKTIPYRRDSGRWTKADTISWVVWIKPSLFADLPTDIATYAELNPDFPQQSTSNQFFGEAQWESYRRLGYSMGKAMFKKPQVAARFLPIIRQRWNRTPNI